MSDTLDNLILYERFIAGKTADEAVIKYKTTYKNSDLIISKSDEIKEKQLKSKAIKNQEEFLSLVKNFKKLIVSFYAIGGAIIPNKCLLNFFKKIFIEAKKNNVERLILSAPEQAFYKKYKCLRIDAAKIAKKVGFENFYVTQQTYIKNSLEEVKELVKCNIKISLVGGRFRTIDSVRTNIIAERELIIDNYKQIRKYLENYPVIDNTQNYQLINWLITNFNNPILQYCYGVNNNIDNDYSQENISVNCPYGKYKNCLIYVICNNNNSASHESQS